MYGVAGEPRCDIDSDSLHCVLWLARVAGKGSTALSDTPVSGRAARRRRQPMNHTPSPRSMRASTMGTTIAAMLMLDLELPDRGAETKSERYID